MHDQRAMRRFDSAANLEEQADTSAQVEAVFARVVRDRSALDEIERDVGQAVVGNAAFDQSRNAGMLQLPKGQALAPELALRIRRVQAPAQDFQSDILAHALDLAACMEHGRRTALAEHRDELEWPDAAAWRKRFGKLGIADRERGGARAAGKQRRGIGVGEQQPFDPRAQGRVGAAQVEKRGARDRLELDRGLEQFAQ